MRVFLTTLLLCLMIVFAQSCTNSNTIKPVFKDQLRLVIADYIKKCDSVSIEREIILLELDSMRNDTSFYRLKTIISRNTWNKAPTDTLQVNGSFVLLSNIWTDSTNQKITTGIVEEHLPLESTKTHNPIVWQIKSIRHTLLVNKQFVELAPVVPAIKFEPPAAE